MTKKPVWNEDIKGDPGADPLLAFKMFLLELKRMQLYTYPYATDEWRWPYATVVTSPCDRHYEPVSNCTCGVLSTVNIESLLEQRDEFESPVEIDGFIPLLGTVQLLGKIVQDGCDLRSWGAFLWGLIKPYDMSKLEWRNLLRGNSDFHYYVNPVSNQHLSLAVAEVQASWKQHGLSIPNLE